MSKMAVAVYPNPAIWKSLGPEHRDTLEAITSLAKSYQEARRMTEASNLLTKVKAKSNEA